MTEGIKQDSDTTHAMWNALTNRLPTKTTKLLAMCVMPVLYQAVETAIGHASIHVSPGRLVGTKVLKTIEEEKPEITYICIPEDNAGANHHREAEHIDKFIEALNSRKHTVVIADAPQRQVEPPSVRRT